MNDTRIAQARALIDDARCLVPEVMDETMPDDQWQVTHWLKEARRKLNDGMSYLEKIQ